ncbi:MAG: hypothetical protein KAX46_01660 [Chromatiaceae bacterium]|nr:hypothetical protein [Chromatiaceae bacterium]
MVRAKSPKRRAPASRWKAAISVMMASISGSMPLFNCASFAFARLRNSAIRSCDTRVLAAPQAGDGAAPDGSARGGWSAG